MVIISIEYRKYVKGDNYFEICGGCKELIGNANFIIIMFRLKEDVIALFYHVDCIELIGLTKLVT